VNELLHVRHICCRFADKIIIPALSFTVKQGQIACLLGPSGCGKTTMEDTAAAVSELEKPDALVAKTGETEKLFRPFGGGGKLGPHLLNPRVVAFLHQNAYSCVLWNAIPRDWADPDGWVDRALEQVASQNHTLLVLHDLPTGAMDHLDAFLDRAEASGAEFHNDFPQECVPMVHGKDMVSLDPYVAAA